MRAVIALAALALAVSTPARADSAAAGRCSLSVTPVTFGTYHPLSGMDGRTTGVLTYNCSSSRPIAIALNHGGNGKGRELKYKGNRARYDLYLDAAGTAVWGDGSNGTQVYRDPSPTPDTNITVPIFGKMPTGQKETVGLYDDTIVVQLTY